MASDIYRSVWEYPEIITLGLWVNLNLTLRQETFHYNVTFEFGGHQRVCNAIT